LKPGAGIVAVTRVNVANHKICGAHWRNSQQWKEAELKVKTGVVARMRLRRRKGTQKEHKKGFFVLQYLNIKYSVALIAPVESLFVYSSHHARGKVGKTSSTELTHVKQISGRGRRKDHLNKVGRKPRPVVLANSNRKQGQFPPYQFAAQPLSLVTYGYPKASFRRPSLVLIAPS